MHDGDEPPLVADAPEELACGRALGKEKLPLCPDGKGLVLWKEQGRA